MEANVSVRSLFGAKLFALNTQVRHAAAAAPFGAACSLCHSRHISQPKYVHSGHEGLPLPA
jgi:hypothetical protein